MEGVVEKAAERRFIGSKEKEAVVHRLYGDIVREEEETGSGRTAVTEGMDALNLGR